MNNGKFDGGLLSEEEKELHNFYKTLLSFTAQSSALTGEFAGIHTYNRENTTGYTDKLFSFLRWSNKEKLLIISNFEENPHEFQLKIDVETIKKLNLKNGSYKLADKLSGNGGMELVVNETGLVEIQLAGLESMILEIL
jgi:hypothetical protein